LPGNFNKTKRVFLVVKDIIGYVLITNREGGDWQFAEPKTKQSRQTIPLPVSTATELVINKK